MEKKFEDAIIELEGIIKQLESGELTLDDSMEKVKQGVELANVCNKKLEQAFKIVYKSV